MDSLLRSKKAAFGSTRLFHVSLARVYPSVRTLSIRSGLFRRAGLLGGLAMKEIKIPFTPNLIFRLLSGGTLRRADSNQKAGRNGGKPRSALDVILRHVPSRLQ